jgi:LysR family nod box-dependent transcriptional activator
MRSVTKVVIYNWSMRYNRLDLNLLPALRALLTEKSVTRAAEISHVTQSAMSGILSRLREYFGDDLMVPVGRRMELTPLGASLANRISDLMVQLDSTLAVRPDFDLEASSRHFSIVASDYAATVLLTDVMRDLHVQAPGVTIELRQPSDNAIAELEAGELDFHIHPQGVLPNDHPSQLLFEDSFVAVVDHNHPDVGDVITLDQYRLLGHVVFQNGGLPLFDRWFEKTAGERRIELIVTNFTLLAPMLIGTRRIATMHARLARKIAEVLPVRLVKFDFETPPFLQMLQWHRYRDLDPGTIWLREKIIAHANAMPR